MSVFDSSDSSKSRKLLSQSLDYGEHIQQGMGVLNGDQAFNQFFMKAQLTMELIGEVREAIKQKIVGGKKKNYIRTNAGEEETNMDMDAVARMEQIWYGHVYVLSTRDPNKTTKILKEELYYKEPKPRSNEKVHKLPALVNLNPVGEIRDNYLWIRIREAVSLADAMQNHNISQLVTSGGFSIPWGDGKEPIFKDYKDLLALNKKTYCVGRPYYHNVVNIERRFWEMDYYIIKANLFRIAQNERFGFYSTQEDDLESRKQAIPVPMK